MRIGIAFMVLVVFAGAPIVASAQTLYIEGGNVYFKADSSKSAVQLTTSGKDEQATLASDGQMAAFVRRTPEKTIKAGGWGPQRPQNCGASESIARKQNGLLPGGQRQRWILFWQVFATRSSLETASASTFSVLHGSPRPRCMS